MKSHVTCAPFARTLLCGASAAVLGSALTIAPADRAHAFNCELLNNAGVSQGTGGATSIPDNATTLACGGGASAVGDGSVSVGPNAGINANAANEGNVAIGQAAGDTVNGDFNSAVGDEAGQNVTGDSNSAFGVVSGNDVTGDENIAVGRAAGGGVIGDTNIAVGLSAGQLVEGDRNVALGADAGRILTGDDNISIGSEAGGGTAGVNNQISVGARSFALGNSAIAIGGDGNDGDLLAAGAIALGEGSIAVGADALVSGLNVGQSANAVALGARAAVGFDPASLTLVDSPGAVAIGAFSVAQGQGATAMGMNAAARDANSVAIGASSFAAGPNDSAFGANARVEADNGLAVGANTLVASGAAGGVAIGSDSGGNAAVASLENQFVLGTANHTYRAPGIASDLSRSRQSGPLEVVTSDRNGNLATDGGQIFGRLDNAEFRIDRAEQDIDELQAGVALAIATEGPDLVANERFGMSLSYGNFEGASAIGGGVTGVVSRNFLKPGARLALTGGLGVGLENGRGDTVVGGRVGGQWTW